MEYPVDKITDATHKQNYINLSEKVDKVLAAFGIKRSCTSGYRTMEDHLRIYKQKGITDKTKIPMKSNHLFGLAKDIEDANGKLKEFVKKNVKLLEELGLYCEDFSATKTWVHFQSVAPKSGKRFFMP